MATVVRVARDASAVIFKIDDAYAAVDTKSHDVRISDELATLTAAGGWRLARSGDADEFKTAAELADASRLSLDIETTTAAAVNTRRRVYRVPQNVKDEAAKALAWHAKHMRGGSNIGLEIAKKLSTSVSVDIDTIRKISRHFPRHNVESRGEDWAFANDGGPSSGRITLAMWGGDAGQRWAQKIVAQHIAMTASGDFQYDDNAMYFGTGEDEDSTDVNQLYELGADKTWAQWSNGMWEASDAPADAPLIIQLDEESAGYLAKHLQSFPDDYVELSELNPKEAQLANFAISELDLDLYSRLSSLIADAIGDGVYSPAERAQNAERQGRGAGGKFAPGGGDGAQPKEKSVAISGPKARLAQPLPVVTDAAQLIQNYLDQVASESGGEADAPPPVQAAGEPAAPAPADAAPAPTAVPAEATPETSPATPLYLAIVDSADTQAVLDVVSIVPPQPTCWRRESGKWVAAPDTLASLQSVSPPPVVELKDAPTLNAVLSQVDVHDSSKGNDAPADAPMAACAYELAAPSAAKREKAAKKGFALPDGSFPINTVADLKNAVQAYGRAKDKAAAKAHIKKRARALGRADLIPEDWKKSSTSTEELVPMFGPFGEVLTIVAVAGRAATPKDEAAVERLMRYWAEGEGAAKIGWGVRPHDFDNCVKHLSKYVGPKIVKGLCANLHHRALGVWPGQEDGGRKGH